MKRLHAAISDDIGDLVTRRPIPNNVIPQIDPFLFLNHHGPQIYPPGNEGLPFGPHPHRGFETVTFIVAGSLAHHDTAGHESVIHAGGIQWMTAGRGVEHSELSPREFLENGGPMEILQLWVNLPSRLKMTEPRYFGLKRDEIPVLDSSDRRVRVNVISGDWDGTTGPVESLTDVALVTIEAQTGGRISFPVAHEKNIFLYFVRGEGLVSGSAATAMELVEMNNDGDTVDLEFTADSLILFGHATPYGEPVVSYGPFVMNTAAEIQQAIRDHREGEFK